MFNYIITRIGLLLGFSILRYDVILEFINTNTYINTNTNINTNTTITTTTTTTTTITTTTTTYINCSVINTFKHSSS